MSADAEPSRERAIESLLAFWADGGVDAMLDEIPVDRIAAGMVRAPVRQVLPAAVASARKVVPAAPDVSATVEAARALAAAAPDLATLATAIAAFEGCPLRFEGAATKAVVYRGNTTAPVLVVGEGPGAEEDAQGAPFVGRSGKLLDRMFAAAGLEGRVLITNTVFWRPPGNRDPTATEQAVCLPFLERIIALTQPQLLVLVGGRSAKSLLKREEGILALRGRWHDWTSTDGTQTVPALPTLHPAFLLRQPAAKKRAWSDLLALAERLDPAGTHP